ncbi:TfdA family taurine catabolism dioxygenase TauD [Methylosinus sp. sav-2]|nr:TfdA family taurine catabolism dioxygenase TauD [Methylosinus sp. sav-2]
MIDTPENLSDLAHRVCELGWLPMRASLSHDRFGDEILSLARTLGEPCVGRNGRLLERLAPRESSKANTNSLSATHGVSAFPLHIDGAHKPGPPRFVILACERPGSLPVPTILARFDALDLTSAERHQCETAPFLIRNGRRSFYSTILDTSRPFLRFDQGCMTALSEAASDVFRTIAARLVKLGPTVIEWAAGDILIVDNWRVLHGRGLPSSTASTDRRLIRVSVQ